MKYSKTMLAASIAASLYASALAYAADPVVSDPQQTPASADADANKKKQNAEELGTVVVTGIRDTEARSLQLKQAYDSHVEIVTAEDIGKLPAKNVADTLERLPGVNISSSSASEGGFDENDRVSLRGTNPSLTQTLINGHTVGTGDWFVLSQVQTVGRSVSYTLLPSEIVSEVVVHKTSEAKILEGGAAGSVDIITRKPLQYSKDLTASASIGGVYADLPGKTDPQFNGLVNWKVNDSFGVLAQLFYEERSLERQGQEVVGGYNQISATDAIAQAHPDLAGVYYPNEIGAVLFTQKRKREGGTIDLEFKPTDNLTLDLDAFYSKLKADNYNRNYMMWGSQFVNSGAGFGSNYTVKNNVLTSATFAPVAGSTAPYVVYDQISRPGAASKSDYVTFDADWRATDRLTFKGQAGITNGSGKSPTQDVMELGGQAGAGASWNMHGIKSPIDWTMGGDNSSTSGIMPSAGWIFGEQGIDVKDKERWAQADGEFAVDNGPLSTIDFGARYAKHTRENLFDVAQGPNFATNWTDPAGYPTSSSHYPGDFGSNVGGSFPSNIWYWTPAQLAAIDAKFANRNPVTRFYFNDIYSVKEKDSAAYVQFNFAGNGWSGNLGVRYVGTDSDISYSSTSPQEKIVTGPITGSAFGDYYWNTAKTSKDNFLPSGNIKFDMRDDMVLRVAASQTLTRPDYSALAGFVSLDDLTHTGSGGNPGLKPIVSTNVDVAWEWYFAPRGLLSVGAYNMDLSNYINFGNETRTYKDMQASETSGHDVFNSYLVSVPHNVDGHVKGIELNYIQPIGDNFGVAANYTYADGGTDNGQPLQGNSRNTFNVSGYFENAQFNARLSYTYRSTFYAGVSRTDSFFQQGAGTLNASFGYAVNSWATVTLDAMNLNDPKLKYYTQSAAYGNQPYAFYVNGRQYYATLRLKF
ncbi:TonB-dependent receptor [Rudaea cellulosilytica]|uniref:TonB-dependent receptor n=1 Tax=Rudaea cellulosilytica TaxID=540746 RepID=UPI000380793D|nr:TonB-dependent receptor [Rudaea cellulosilytica]